jgi:hypothetical protein
MTYASKAEVDKIVDRLIKEQKDMIIAIGNV